MLDYRSDEGLTPWIERILDALPSEDFPGSAYAVVMPMKQLRAAMIPGMAATFESDIREAGKWHGRGPTVLIDAPTLYRDYYGAGTEAGLETKKADAFARRAVAGVLIHELAHVLAQGDDGQADPIGGHAGEAKRALFSWTTEPPNPEHAAANSETYAPWAKHDARFLRAACHLTKRMRKQLKDLTYSDVVDCDKYGLTPISNYVACLLDELESGAPIRSLLASRAPKQFRDQWREDFARWWQGIPGEASPEEYEIARQALKLCHE